MDPATAGPNALILAIGKCQGSSKPSPPQICNVHQGSTTCVLQENHDTRGLHLLLLLLAVARCLGRQKLPRTHTCRALHSPTQWLPYLVTRRELHGAPTQRVPVETYGVAAFCIIYCVHRLSGHAVLAHGHHYKSLQTTKLKAKHLFSALKELPVHRGLQFIVHIDPLYNVISLGDRSDSSFFIAPVPSYQDSGCGRLRRVYLSRLHWLMHVSEVDSHSRLSLLYPLRFGDLCDWP